MAAIPPIDVAALAALDAGFAPIDAVVAVAIAGAESAYNPAAEGDHWTLLAGEDRTIGQSYNCNGYTSFGLWQIHITVHRSLVGQLSGRLLACGQASWLFDPDNNARVARALWVPDGFNPWTTFTSGAFLSFMDQAHDAVNRVRGLPPQGLPPFVSLEELAPVPLE